VGAASDALIVRSHRQDRAASGALESATDFFVRKLCATNYFGARQHRDETIVADGGRIFLGQDFEELFHTTWLPTRRLWPRWRDGDWRVPMPPRPGFLHRSVVLDPREAGLIYRDLS